ncbi:hypothetical protein ACLKA7_014965 [Drosophila subpalustris]
MDELTQDMNIPRGKGECSVKGLEDKGSQLPPPEDQGSRLKCLCLSLRPFQTDFDGRNQKIMTHMIMTMIALLTKTTQTNKKKTSCGCSKLLMLMTTAFQEG